MDSRRAAVWDTVAQSARTAASHRLRSGLGALAVAVGVATVALVISVLDGLSGFARTTTARSFGADTFVLAQIGAAGSLDRGELEKRLRRNLALRRADARFLDRWAGASVLYAPTAQISGQASAGERRFDDAAISGTTAALADIRDLGLARGRFLSLRDEALAAPVAVIGDDVAQALFPGLDPLGRSLRLGGRRFQVVGVQSRLGSAAGASLDRYVWIPLPAFERVFGPPSRLQVFARARDPRLTMQAEDATRTVLRARRRLRPGVEDNFDLLSPSATRGFVAALAERVSGAALPLGAMALLASIVVVTNTILVSVSQRTREIGVRRALGATRRRIVQEVLVEATLIGLTGGLVGLLAVLALVWAARAAGWDLPFVPAAFAWGFFAAGLAGVLAGLYPARRAAGIDVIAAVRTE